MTEKSQIAAINIEDEMKRSYIDYSMSVIIGRAIPDIRDGLKPVHRRILYAMYDLRNFHNEPYKKSARIVGDVIGKYHPHGDAAVYDTLVRMAQDFSMRHPTVDGQGNFGSVDGDSAAAMRYTEARMAKIAESLLADIEKDTVDFQPNYDETQSEPLVLPSRIPNLLLNGSSGIAVGMATNIPPHNLGELIDGIQAVIKDPDITVEKLIKHIPGPDFPTRGFIYGIDGIVQAYKTGRGRVLIRARAMIEEQPKTGKNAIVVTEIPYNVNKAKLIERIADLVKTKKLEGISDLRDESDRDGMRIVIELKKDVIPTIVLNQLYKTTPMETTFGIIMLSIVGGRPRILALKEMLLYFVEHRREVVTRRTRYDLARAEERAHILEGLVTALNNIDEVIEIIKTSKNQPDAKTRLMKRFGFSDIQAQAILDMRLGRLTSLEVEKVQKEYREILALIEELKRILADESVLMDVITKELSEIKREFADERRTEILSKTKELTIEDLVAQEDMIVTVTHNNYIKRTPLSQYRTQKRGGKGVSGMDIYEGDFVERLFVAQTHDQVLIITDAGRAYGLKVHEIPQAGRVSRGRSASNLVQMLPDEKIASMLVISDIAADDESVVMASRSGMIKKTTASEFRNAKHSGVVAMGLADDDVLVAARTVFQEKKDTVDVILATSQGCAIRFPESDIRTMGRSAQGVRGINLSGDDRVISIALVNKKKYILTVTENGFGKRSKLTEYGTTRRGGKGIITMKTGAKTGPVVGVRTINDDDEVMMISNKGMFLRMDSKDISIMGRNTQGVKLMNLKSGENLSGIAVLAERENGDDQ
ncbi:MAG: DNA gyrase subunit A [Deltaproteobacteria bacterium]|nr:DNA gyrase subunit A [Candidatus Zymogenaceae bacterium]